MVLKKVLYERLPFNKNSGFRGFNKHQRPTKHVGYFAHRGRLLFLQEEEEPSLNNVKKVVSSRKIATEFRRPPVLIENPVH